MRAGFRTKVFIGAFAAAALSLLALAGLMAWQVRERQRTAIERHLSDEAYLTADLLSKATTLANESSPQTLHLVPTFRSRRWSCRHRFERRPEPRPCLRRPQSPTPK